MTAITIPPLSPFPGRGAAPEDYIAQADTMMQELPGAFAKINEISTALNLGAGVLQAGYLPPVPYAAGVSMTVALQTVEYAGSTYAPLLGALPFVTSGVFEVSKFRLIQGVTGAQLAEPTAAERIGYATQGVAKKLQESTSICDLGGIGNYNPTTNVGTNCIDALALLTQQGPARRRVRFPAIPGQTNCYRLSFPAGYTVLRDEAIIDADPGVSIYVEGVFLECEFLRPTPVISISSTPTTSLPVTYKMSPGGAAPAPDVAEKARWLNGGDVILPTRRVIDPRTGWRSLLSAWPGNTSSGGDGSGIAGTTKVTFDATSVIIVASSSDPADGALHAGYRQMVAGDELSARLDVMSGSAGYSPAIIVRTATGHSGVLLRSQGASSFKKIIGAELVQRDVTPPGMAQHQSYAPYTSLISVRMVTAYRYAVLINGMVVAEDEFADPISEVGFGGYISGVCNFRWTDLFLSHGHAPSAARLVGLLIIGDSQSADRLGCWARWCREALEGTYGIRVIQYNNYAVSGHGSAQQLEKLISLGVPAGTTDAVIQIGTNNIQGATSVTTMIADISSMFDRLQNAGARIYVSLPPIWYTQDQAGTRGAASVRYAEGTPYRIAIMRLCAERGIPLLDSLPAYGPILANFVNPTLTPNLVGLDPMVADNIHQGPFMDRIMGYSIAGMLLGRLSHVGTNATGWTDMPATWPARNSWVIDFTEGAQYRITDGGSRRWRAQYSSGAGGVTVDGTTVQTLGRLLWPRRPLRLDAITSEGERARMVLGTDGQLKIYGAEALPARLYYIETGLYDVL